MKLDALLEKLIKLVNPIVEEKGYELYHLEYVKENRENYLRIYIDKEDGISLDDCEKVSRALSDMLDLEDPIADAYYLEVSSPGLNRELHSDKHLSKNIGNLIQVKLSKAINDQKAFIGNLLGFDDNELKLNVEGNEISILRNKVKSINLEGEI